MIRIAAASFLMYGAFAHADCSADFFRQSASTQKAVDALRADKPGQMRVLASDGSEYSAGEISWMKSQLHLVTEACDKSDLPVASKALAAVDSLLESRRHR